MQVKQESLVAAVVCKDGRIVSLWPSFHIISLFYCACKYRLQKHNSRLCKLQNSADH